jgi:hypothetical protein
LQELDETIADILYGFHQQRPLTLREIASTVQNKIHNPCFRNAEISLILHDGRVARCDITPNTARCIIETPFTDPLGNLITEADPIFEIFEM